jgi:hypothetical protein
MKRRRQVRDYHELPAWNEARSLTLAAYQLSEQTSEDRAEKITGDIQRACISILTALQHTDNDGIRRETYMHLESTANQLGTLLSEAHTKGIIGTHDLAMMMRDVQGIKESLTNLFITQTTTNRVAVT